MDWNVTLQLVILVIAYVGGIGTIGYYITNSLGKRIDNLRSGMTSQHCALREDMKEIRDEIGKKHDLLIAHISGHTLHNS